MHPGSPGTPSPPTVPAVPSAAPLDDAAAAVAAASAAAPRAGVVDRRAPPVLLTLVVGYASFYLCRANVESAFPLLQGAFGFSKAELGLLSCSGCSRPFRSRSTRRARC
jgi:hypothetical protein